TTRDLKNLATSLTVCNGTSQSSSPTASCASLLTGGDDGRASSARCCAEPRAYRWVTQSSSRIGRTCSTADTLATTEASVSAHGSSTCEVAYTRCCRATLPWTSSDQQWPAWRPSGFQPRTWSCSPDGSLRVTRQLWASGSLRSGSR